MKFWAIVGEITTVGYKYPKAISYTQIPAAAQQPSGQVVFAMGMVLINVELNIVEE
jgi:hypothetical protein